MRVVVLGSTGYTGMVLLRILLSHPNVDEITPVSRSGAGKPIRAYDPGLPAAVKTKVPGGAFVALESANPEGADVVISALPHATAAEIVGPLVGSVPVIDLSADFRLADAKCYEETYGHNHPFPSLLAQAAYGLCEWNREAVRKAPIVANPGCYPTATLLPLLPFRELISGPIVVNAMSGISGAGRKEKTDLLFGERSENANAYNPGRAHRHVPEIEEHLAAAGASVLNGSDGQHAGRSTPDDHRVVFTPHLVPLKQGMVVTTFTALSVPLTQSEAEKRITDAYADETFVGLSPRGIPQTRDVRNSNRCEIGVRVDGRELQLFSVIDNLYKGASGQAIQNMNIRLGFSEGSGLSATGEF